MKPFFICIIALLLAGCNMGKQSPKSNSIVGKWAQSHTHDDKTYHDFIGNFRTDGTYDGIEDGKVVLTGRYKQSNDTITLEDAVCSPHNIGIYKLIFYAEDSLHFQTIADSCDARRNGTEPSRFKRIKT